MYAEIGCSRALLPLTTISIRVRAAAQHGLIHDGLYTRRSGGARPRFARHSVSATEDALDPRRQRRNRLHRTQPLRSRHDGGGRIVLRHGLEPVAFVADADVLAKLKTML